jgi:hypothetical protein
LFQILTFLASPGRFPILKNDFPILFSDKRILGNGFLTLGNDFPILGSRKRTLGKGFPTLGSHFLTLWTRPQYWEITKEH